MCGIVALLPRYDRLGETVTPADVLAGLAWNLAPADSEPAPTVAVASEQLTEAHRRAEEALRLISTPAGLALLAADADLREQVAAALDGIERRLDGWDALLDDKPQGSPEEVEAAQAQAVVVRDLLWMLRNDRLAAARRMRALGFGETADARLAVSYLGVDSVLDAIDRLEVRGRDSAGVQIWVGLDETDRGTLETLASARDPWFRSGAVELVDDGIVFVYKRAAILGSLGDNVAHLRTAIARDERLAAALRLPSARISVLAHSRWASVGRISEANAHPVNSIADGAAGPYSAAVLNGDIDNHVELRRKHGVAADEITTDAKLIPVMYSAALGRGEEQVLRARLAIDAQPQPVLLAHRDLRGVDDAPRPALVVDQQVRVVLQLVTRAEGGGVRAQGFHFETADVARQVPGVQPDVPHG